MREESVKYFRDILNSILELDSNATFQFENCGSGTNVLNIFFSKKSIKKITMKDLDRLKDLGVYGNDDGMNVSERFMEENNLFIVLS
jgi:hypothetical protein